MKKLLPLLFLLFSYTLDAQLDREHWFPPMFDRTNIPRNTFESIYISTNESTPFPVSIYHQNAVIATVTVSKGNPVRYKIANRNQIITENAANLFTPVSMGYYLKGEKAFYATFRFSTFNHGEIVTSKGTAGLGTEFRVAMAPITALNPILDFMTGIMATEDNTEITITEFDPGIVFTDNVPRTRFDIILQKGQSYLIEGGGDISNNAKGFIGAKISSNKPVVVTNGNFNGQYATTSTNSSDILMDQSVPIDKLGQEFVLMKGNGDLSSGMEKAIVVATENGTNIYVNGSTTPAATLDAGEFFLTASENYQLQRDDHYNMHLKSDKNVYVYQLLAGDGTTSELATGGFNYIPPLSCYLPKRIDEIGLIDENEYESNYAGSTNVPTKLNIITERGAHIEVFRNGSPIALTSQNGPFDVTGNPNWVTYSIKNITGNVSLISSRAVTAGISAGNDAVGYGGYFAGFSYLPVIVKSAGECLPDVVLEVTEGFSSYQWLLKTASGYVNAPGESTKYQYRPTQAGIYAVKLKEGSCTEIQTADYKFFNCNTYTNYTFDTCSDVTVTPSFVLSSQLYNISSATVVSPPAKGSVNIQPDGKIVYTAYPNATGTDRFKFSFCGTGLIPDCETVQITVNLKQVVAQDAVLTVCSATNTGIFDLTAAAINTDAAVLKTYYQDAAYTQKIPEKELASYVSAAGFVYVKLENSFPCTNTAVIELRIQNPPIILADAYTFIHCDESLDGSVDGFYHADLDRITPAVLPVNNGFNVRYYSTPESASVGGADNVTGTYPFNLANPSVWIRVESSVCPPNITEIRLKTGNPFPIIKTVSTEVCDNDLNQTETVSIEQFGSLFSTESFDRIAIFDDLTKAQQGNSLFEINTSQTITNHRTFYFRFSKAGWCDVIGTLHLRLKQPLLSPLLKDQQICEEGSTILDAGPGFSAYQWSTGDTSQTISGVKVGEYWVDLTSNGCTYRQHVKITKLPDPEITRIEIQGSTVTIHISGGNAPYYYSLDGGTYQTSNVFTQVSAGEHTVAVMSADRCSPVKATFNVIQIYNAISPNGDGINEYLNYSGLLGKEEPSLKIFDRLGNLVFSGDANNRFLWDGTVAGKKVPTGTFWFVIRWREPKAAFFTEFAGWVLVKNRN